MTGTYPSSFNIGVEEFHPPNGRKGLEGLRSCKGTHHARHLHMTKPSQVTFHGHHFRAIMGFIMNGLAPRLANVEWWNGCALFIRIKCVLVILYM